MKVKKIATILAVFVTTFSMYANGVDVSKQSCEDAITSLELPGEPYEFKDGWFGDKHIFGGTVECSEKNGQLFIKQNRTTFVEDGFFGLSTLAARDKALAIHKEMDEELEDQRDRLITNAKEKYKASLATLEGETQQQLQQIRDGGLPDVIAAAIETERLERNAAEERSAVEKAEREVRKEELKIERQAKRQADIKASEERAVVRKAEREIREAELKIEREAERKQKEKERLASLKAEQVRDANCRKELDCWGEKAGTYASIYCPKHIERLAKNEHEWTDGFLGAKFTRYRWSDKEAGVVTLIGDSLKFQNGFGAMVNVVYECDVNPEPGIVINVRVSEGKL